MNHKKLLREWQKRLGMQDWRIAMAEGCDPKSMSIAGSSGCVSWEESTKTAYIQILDPKHYGDKVVPFDFEKTMLHELLHLKFSLLCDDGDELRERIVHMILDDIARALVEAKRMKPPEEEKPDDSH